MNSSGNIILFTSCILLAFILCYVLFINACCLDDPDLLNNVSLDWVSEARELNRNDQPDLALLCINNALDQNNTSFNKWFLKGEILFNLNDLNAALECYNSSIKINPLHADSWKRKGDILFEKGNYKDAINCYNKSMSCFDSNNYEKIDTDKKDLFFKIGLSWGRIENFKHSGDNFRKGILFNRTDDDYEIRYERGKIFLYSGKEEHDIDDINESIDCFEEVIRAKEAIDEEKFFQIKKDAIFAEGIAYLFKGNFNNSSRYDYEKALSCFNDSIDLSDWDSSDTWNIFFCRGVAFSKIGDYSSAKEAFLDAQKLKNDVGISEGLQGLAISAVRDMSERIYEKPLEWWSLLSYIIQNSFRLKWQSMETT